MKYKESTSTNALLEIGSEMYSSGMVRQQGILVHRSRTLRLLARRITAPHEIDEMTPVTNLNMTLT
jgi:hypothetical protein